MPGLSSGTASFQAFPSHPRAFILTAADTGPNKILQPRRRGGWVRSNCFSAGTGGQHRRPASWSSRCVSICHLKSVPVLQTIWLGQFVECAPRQNVQRCTTLQSRHQKSEVGFTCFVLCKNNCFRDRAVQLQPTNRQK